MEQGCPDPVRQGHQKPWLDCSPEGTGLDMSNKTLVNSHILKCAQVFLCPSLYKTFISLLCCVKQTKSSPTTDILTLFSRNARAEWEED